MPKTNKTAEAQVKKIIEDMVNVFVETNVGASDFNKHSFMTMWGYVKSGKGTEPRKQRVKELREGAKLIEHKGIRREYLKTVSAVATYVEYANSRIANLPLIDFDNLVKVLNTLKRAEKVNKVEFTIKHIKDAYEKGISSARYNNKLATILRGVNGLISEEVSVNRTFDLNKEVEKIEKQYTQEQLKMLIEALQNELNGEQTSTEDKVAA